MHFILAPGCMAKFEHLRQDYEAQKHVDLNHQPSLIGVPIFFGGTDVVRRNNQIAFLEKIATLLRVHLKEKHIKTEPQWHVFILASRSLIAACLYVQIQIGHSKRNSVLYRIIEDNLGINSENFLDEEDKEIYYLTAKQLINTNNAFEDSNLMLKKAQLKPFSVKEWNYFSTFLADQCHTKEYQNTYITFPVTSITKPLFGTVFSYIGTSAGIALATNANHSTSVITTRLQLTALLGSTLFIINPEGAVLFAPVIATQFLASFYAISLGHMMGSVARILGQGIGIGVGLPLDIAYNLLSSTCSIIHSHYRKTPPLAAINGIRLADGAFTIEGVPVRLISEQELTTITHDGVMPMDDHLLPCAELA